MTNPTRCRRTGRKTKRKGRGGGPGRGPGARGQCVSGWTPRAEAIQRTIAAPSIGQMFMAHVNHLRQAKILRGLQGAK